MATFDPDAYLAKKQEFDPDAYLAKGNAPSAMQKIKQGAGNLAAGLVRGAGSIGATLLAPIDMASDAMDGKGLSLESNRQRRADMDAALGSMGAETDSILYKGGQLVGEIAGTAGAGGVVANTVSRMAPSAAAAAPNLLTAIRTAGMSGGNAITRAAGGAVSGGASAGLVDPTQAAAGAAIGGALPPALMAAGKVGHMAGNAIRGGGVSPEVGALAARAKELGIDIPADRLVSSKPMDAVASGLNYMPFSGRSATEAKMNSQLNQAVSRTFGQDSSNVTMALRKAGVDLGGKFDATLKNTGVQFDKQLLDEVASVYNRAESELGSDALKPITSKVNDLIEKGASGTIDGQAAYNIKRELDRIGRGNTPTAFHALELKGVLMDGLNRSLGPTQAAAFAQTRQQYGNMLSLEKLAKNGVEGELSAARLANMKNINNEPLQELADIAAQFVKAREGQHGAMQRAVAGMAGFAVGGPTGLAIGAGVGRGANMALNSNSLRALVMNEPNALQKLATPQARELVYRSAPVAGSGR